MNDQSIEGVGRISGGEYNKITIEGVGTCSGNCKAKEIIIDGVFHASGLIETEFLECDGVSNFKSDVRTKTTVVDGVMNIKNRGKLEATEIRCDGVINTNGEVSADTIKVDGCINANEIYGDRVEINSKGTHGSRKGGLWVFNLTGLGKIFNSTGDRRGSNIITIEATTIYLAGVYANMVSGHDIIIDEDCVIEHVDCTGTLKVHHSSAVRKITGVNQKKEEPMDIK